jgi:hypothetical protein
MKKLSLLGVVVLIILVTVIIGITILSYKNESTNKPEVVHEYREIKKLGTSSEKYDIYYEIYTLEGCEYIVIPGSYFTWGTHKGNCKNPIHKKYGEL